MADVTDSKSVGSDTVWVRVPPPAPKKNAPMGAFFFGAKGSANLFTDLKAPALIEREGGTAMVPPSHFPLLAEGGACAFRVGAFFFWWCRAERLPFCRFENHCPN